MKIIILFIKYNQNYVINLMTYLFKLEYKYII